MMLSMMEEKPQSTRSPPLRNLLQFAMTSGKRAHSPDGSPGDRPAKRLSLAIGDVSIGCRHFNTSSVNGSRYPSEDWVQQAGELTINSPIVSLTVHHSPVDVEMSTDPDESGAQPLQTSYPLPALVSQHQHTEIESQLPNSLDRHYERRYSEKMQPVFDTMVSPILPNKHTSEEQEPSTRPSTPTDSSSNAMVLSSPVASFSQIPSSPAKRRVFFGPRTGCEKCRLGVKGHFIHSE